MLLLHPRQAIGRLFNRKDLPRILLDASKPLPQPDRFGGGLEVRPEIGRVELAEEDFDAGELFAVAVGDGDLDVDGAADVFDGAGEGAGEGSADGAGGEHFEGEGNTAAG